MIGDKTTQNGTAIADIMLDLVAENNERQAELLPFVRRKLYDADIQLFDTHALFSQLFADPTSTYGELLFVPSLARRRSGWLILTIGHRPTVQHRQLVPLLSLGRMQNMHRAPDVHVHGRPAPDRTDARGHSRAYGGLHWAAEAEARCCRQSQLGVGASVTHIYMGAGWKFGGSGSEVVERAVLGRMRYQAVHG